MGIFGKVKSFLFETETQILIKAELETQREANKKLYDWNQKLQSHNDSMQAKMDNVLEEVDRNRSVMVGFGGDFHEILAKIREQLDSQDNVIHEGIGKLLETTEHTQAALRNHNQELISHAEVLHKHDETIKGKLQIVYDNFMRQFVNLDKRLQSLDVTVSDMIQSAHDQTTVKLEGLKEDSSLLISTVGNIEEVVTNPKPHSDLMELVTSIQKGVEHINGFLNDEEYKQQWDMKQITGQLVKVQALLESVEALIPEPPGNTQTKILEVFASTDYAYLSPKHIIDKLGMSKKQVYSALVRMCNNGTLVLLGRGQYALPSVGESIANDSSEE